MNAADALRALHVSGDPLVLPNVWDADTARLVEEAGFPVVATSSVAVAGALGYSDHEQAPAAEMFAAATRIARAVSVPVTVDAEAGYGMAAAEFVERLLETGAVGCNLEDTDHERGQLSPVARQAEWLAAVREAAGEELVINARIDLFFGGGNPRDVLPEAIERAIAYLGAGVDCVYPIALREPDVLAEFVRAVRPAAVNANRIEDTDVAALGVARISLGGGVWHAARGFVREYLAKL